MDENNCHDDESWALCPQDHDDCEYMTQEQEEHLALCIVAEILAEARRRNGQTAYDWALWSLELEDVA